MRKSEALALTWQDIDVQENEISINKAVGYSHRLYIRPPKTGSERNIKMDEATMTILKEWNKRSNRLI